VEKKPTRWGEQIYNTPETTVWFPSTTIIGEYRGPTLEGGPHSNKNRPFQKN